MKLSELKNLLHQVKTIKFVQPNGFDVPSHFHITEVGVISKHFIDCGGTVRTEKNINLQLWTANDTQHHLEPEKLLKIIAISEKIIGNEDLELEVEYQTETIGKYGIDFTDNHFILTAKQTNCLAKDNCGIPTEKIKLQLSGLKSATTSCCVPGGGCC